MSSVETGHADPFDDEPFGRFGPTPLQAALIRLARNTPLKRGVFRDATTRAVMALRAGPLDIRYRGAAFRLRGEQNLIECGLLLNPTYNAADIDFLIEGSTPQSNFVDIGSNVGLYAQLLALAAPHGRTLAIDANPLMVRRLCWNAAATGLGNLDVVHAGVSDRDGTGDLQIRKEDLAIVTLVESQIGAIPIRTLSGLVEQAGIDRIHGLKIDIEGHEDKALVPFLDAAPRALLPSRIVIEHPGDGSDYPGCAACFDRLGYRLHGRSRNNSRYLLDS